MNNNLLEKLKLNAILDLAKEDINIKEKGEICTYLKEKGYTLSKIAVLLNKPKTTIHTWINGRIPYQISHQTPHKFLVFLKHTKNYSTEDYAVFIQIKNKLEEILKNE